MINCATRSMPHQRYYSFNDSENKSFSVFVHPFLLLFPPYGPQTKGFSLSLSSLSLLFLGLVRHVFALWQSCENLFLFGRLPKKNISLFTEKRVFLPVSHPHFDLFARFFLTLSLSFPSSLRLDGAQSSTFLSSRHFARRERESDKNRVLLREEIKQDRWEDEPGKIVSFSI